MNGPYVDVASLVPSTMANAAIGAIGVAGGGRRDLVVVGGERARRFEIVLSGERAWNAYLIEPDEEETLLVLETARIQVDPLSLIAERAERGDLLATAGGWALRCITHDGGHPNRFLDALIVPGDLAVTRFSTSAYRRWRVVSGEGAAERVINECGR